jgi:hypothetical protein
MYADISRDIDPPVGSLRLVQEQGRALLDAEANEQTAILLDRLQALARDLLGPYWGPADLISADPVTFDTGFRIGKPDGGSFTIGPGRYYVNGLRVENGAKVSSAKQPDLEPDQVALPAAGDFLVYLDVWERFDPAATARILRRRMTY